MKKEGFSNNGRFMNKYGNRSKKQEQTRFVESNRDKDLHSIAISLKKIADYTDLMTELMIAEFEDFEEGESSLEEETEDENEEE